MSRPHWSRLVCCFAVGGSLLLALQVPGAAAEPATPAPAVSAPAEASSAELARQLDADEFTQREEASRRLTELGAAAVPDLARAAQGKSLEASSRAFSILKKFAGGKDAATQTAARDSLAKIAAQRETAEKNKDEALAAAAARASEILGQQQAPQNSIGSTVPPGVPVPGLLPGMLPPGVMPPAQIPFGGPRMIIRGNGVIGNRISIRAVDGTREIDADETQADGQQRNVKIVSDPKSGIRMEVTTTKDGKSQTEKYAVKDAESLQKDHPEAFKIYQQYNGAGGQVQIGGGQIQIGGGQIQIQGGIQIDGGGPRIVPQPMKIELDPNAENQLRQLFDAIRDGEGDAKGLQSDLMKEHRRRIEELQKRLQEMQQAAPKPGEDNQVEKPAQPAK